MRAALRLGAAIALACVAGLVPIAGARQAAQTPQQPSVFRSATNLVTVDAYPRKDGRIVEGLTRADFEILEDGVPQAVDQFEFVRVEPVPEAERRDPNNTREMLQLAADPHNRVFVTFLDVFHTSIVGSHDIRGPLVEMLNKVVAPNDLFGVTTSRLPAKFLVLGRKMQSVEEQLTSHWPWGLRNETTHIPDPSEPTELLIDRCFATNPITGLPRGAVDDGVGLRLVEVLVNRHREELTLTNLKDLVTYVGSLREARSLVVLVTDGWRLFRPDNRLIEDALKEQATWGATPGAPPIVVQPGGRMGVGTGLNNSYSQNACNTELARLGGIDDDRLFKDIIALANRTNVVFYPVNAGGLEVFDRTMANPIPIMKEMNWHTTRVDSALTLAENTDGIAVVNTNDLRAGLGKIVDDVSAYYLLGYYSTNSKADGKYRKITVRLKQKKDVAVVARRGYVATAETAATKSAAVAAASTGTSVKDALGSLTRIGGSDLAAYGAVSGSDLLVVAEIASDKVATGQWNDGGTVKVVVTGPNGDSTGTATARVDPGARSALVRLPLNGAAGPWRVGVTFTGSAGTLDVPFNVPVSAGRLVADPLLYRGATTARSPLRPVAEFLFHRTERLRMEFGALRTIDQRTVRVLDPRGQPLPLDATITERDDNGHTTIVADLNLAPLSPGDYVLELSVSSGADTEKRQIAFRLVR